MARIAGFELTRANVIDATLRLMESHDVSALSIRSIAQELGVTPGALYHHFSNKDELLTAVVDAVYAQIETSESGVWNEQIHALLASLHGAFRRYPGAVPYLLAHAVATPNGRRVITGGLEYLRRAGFDDAEVGEAAVMCAVVLTGQAQVESFRLTQAARVRDELLNDPEAVADAATMLLVAPFIGGFGDTFDTDFTVDLVVHELERRHAARKRRKRS